MTQPSHHDIWMPFVALVGVPAANLLYRTLRNKKAKADAAAVQAARFDYTGFDWNWPPVLVGVCPLGGFLWLFAHLSKSFVEVGWLLSIAMTGFMLLLAFLFLIGPCMALFLVRDRRRSESISVSLEGIRFTDGPKQVEARWDEVDDYFITLPGGWFTPPSRRLVVTQRRTFDFATSIKQERLLHTIITRRATHATVTEWAQRIKKIENGSTLPIDEMR